ncbi:Uncharacterised protein [Yersinia nurmii]|uniref:Uncharacterized protein n=1 Tax=Yersinia nurmii TaxID=685706 RepID=A0ABM9S3H6_9GAMM|nr:Uncharacterised protein [Yersinia nurmii]
MQTQGVKMNKLRYVIRHNQPKEIAPNQIKGIASPSALASYVMIQL